VQIPLTLTVNIFIKYQYLQYLQYIQYIQYLNSMTNTAHNTSTKKKPRGLGRGLDTLLGIDHSNLITQVGKPNTLLVSQLQSGAYQPRTQMDEAALNILAESIKSHGLIQPILVRSLNVSSQGHIQYEIIAGERRWRASQIAGLTEVPVLVKEVSNENAAIMALIENIQRENLNPLEEAQGIDRLVREFGLTHDIAAHAVGRSRSTVSNLLRLLNLCLPVQTMLMAGDLDMGHARALLTLDNATQIQLAHQIVQKKLSVRDAEKLVNINTNNLTSNASNTINNTTKSSLKTPVNQDTQRLVEQLSDSLGAAVVLEMGKNGKGTLTISFKGLDVLQGVIEKLGIIT
jgi:ParB family transcriptional regulator, chromosome partitioning protein